MKPDWKDAPEWANYLAMDEDGKWYWYEHEPVLMGRYWTVKRGSFSYAETEQHWAETKEARPTFPQVSRNEKPC